MRLKLFLVLPIFLALAGCKDEATTGPVDIKYDREVCEYCKMIISDPRFAAEVRLAEGEKVFKFDDIGGAVLWLHYDKPGETHQTEIWVRDMKTGTKWLEAKKVFYLGEQHSPMEYGFGAVEAQEKDTVDFAGMSKSVIAHGSTSRCAPPPETGERPSVYGNGQKG